MGSLTREQADRLETLALMANDAAIEHVAATACQAAARTPAQRDAYARRADEAYRRAQATWMNLVEAIRGTVD